MSGIINTLFSLNTLSALTVVGEFAASTTTSAFMLLTLEVVMTPPTAAGINTLHSTSRIS